VGEKGKEVLKMEGKAFTEVKIINGPKGVVIGKAEEILLLHVNSGLNSYRIAVHEMQIEGKPDLNDVPDLGWNVLKTYMV